MTRINIEEQMIEAVTKYARESTEKDVLAEYVRQHELSRNDSVNWGGKRWCVVGVLANDRKYYSVHVCGNDNYDGNKREVLMRAINDRFHPYTIFCVYQ